VSYGGLPGGEWPRWEEEAKTSPLRAKLQKKKASFLAKIVRFSPAESPKNVRRFFVCPSVLALSYRGQLLKNRGHFKHRYREKSVLEMPETS
jgi:hypothetical protein